MCNPVKEFKNAIDSLGDAASDLVDSASNVVDNFLNDPLPTLEVIAITYVLGPEGAAVFESEATAAIVANATVTAANGGNMEDIAIAAAKSYAAGKIGEGAGDEYSSIDNETLKNLGPQYADEALIKQVVTSASGAAALTAMNGGSFENILESGITASVNSYVTKSLADQGYSKVDSQLVGNATSAATKAILKGTSIPDAIGASVAATAIRATIKGEIGSINHNNELISGLKKEYDELFPTAKDLYDKYVKPSEDTVAGQITELGAIKKTYNDTYEKFDTAYKSYQSNKDWFNNYDKKMVQAGWEVSIDPDTGSGGYFKRSGGHWADVPDQEGGSYRAYIPDKAWWEGDDYKTSIKYDYNAPTQDSYKKAANADAKLVNSYAESLTLSKASYDLVYKSYTKNVEDLDDIHTTYKTGVLDPLDAKISEIRKLEKENEGYAKSIGENIISYESQIKSDAEGIIKEIGEETVTNAKNEVTAMNAGFKNYADYQAAKDEKPADFYAKKEGFQDAAEKEAINAEGYATYDDYKKAGADRVTEDEAIKILEKAGLSRDATPTDIAALMRGDERDARSLATKISDVESVTFDGTQFKNNEEALLAAQAAGYNTFKSSDGNTYTITSKEQYDSIVSEANKAGIKDPFSGSKVVDINGNELSGLVLADEPYEIVITAKRDPAPETYAEWMLNQDELRKLGGTNFPKWLSDQLNLVSIVAKEYKGTTSGDTAKLVEQVLAFGGRNIGSLVKQIAQSTAATGLVDYNNIVAKTASAIERWGEKAQGGNLDAREKGIATYVNDTKDRLTKDLGREPTTFELTTAQAKSFYSAVVKDPLAGFSLMAGEAIQELPFLLASGGVGKIGAQLFGKAAGYAVAMGTDGALNATESFAGNYTEVYETLRSKGFSDEAAKAKATTSGYEAALITFGSSLVGDNALVKSFMGDALSLSTGMLTKEAAKQYVTEYAEGMFQSASSQYAINGKVDWSKATAAGAIEGAIGSAVSTGFIAANGLNESGVVGKDSKGDNVTLREYLDGTKQVSTLDDNFNLSKDDSNKITIGDAKGYYTEFTKNPDVTSTEYFQTVDFFRDSGYANPTSKEITDIVGGQEDLIGDKLKTSVEGYTDPLVVTEQEAKDYFRAQGYEPTAEEVATYIGVKNELDIAKTISEYADPKALTKDEVVELFKSEGLSDPTAEELAKFVKQGDEQAIAADIKAYADPLGVTTDEFIEALKKEGYTSVPTKEELDKFTGRKPETETLKSAGEYADPLSFTRDEAVKFFEDIGYTNPTEDDINAYVGMKNEAETKAALEGKYDALATSEQEVRDMFRSIGYDPNDKEVARFVGQKAEDVQLALAKEYGNTANVVKDLTGREGRTVSQADIDALTKMISGEQTVDLSYDVNKDNQITQADIDVLSGFLNNPNAKWDPNIGTHWAPTGIYKTVYDQNLQRLKDIEDQKVREAEAARKSNLNFGLLGFQGAVNAMLPQVQALQAQAKADAEKPVEVVQKSEYFDFGQPLDVGFFGDTAQPLSEKEKLALNQQGIVKIASGGSIDDLLSLLYRG